jgi:hypothetical protein
VGDNTLVWKSTFRIDGWVITRFDGLVGDNTFFERVFMSRGSELSMQDENARSPLLPDRMRQGDFFVCDIFDAAPKGDMASMEHPIFSISTKPDRNIRRYENGKNFVEVTPSVKGLATVHDRDVLIFCISQIMAAVNEGREVGQTLRFRAHDLLAATNRGSDGRGYEQLRAAFERLSGTRIETNITTGNTEVLDGFGLIERYRIVRETRGGRMQDIEVKLSDWVYSAIQHREVLTLSRDYFRLRKPLERRLYEIARKHCGAQSMWRIGLVKLKYKCGSHSTDKEFKRLLSKIIDENQRHGHMPDYDIALEGENAVFLSKGTVPQPPAPEPDTAIPPLKGETYQKARAAAPGWDIYVLESEWREWATECPRNPDGAFIGFCRKVYEKRGRP